jgi:hypothetical protein
MLGLFLYGPRKDTKVFRVFEIGITTESLRINSSLTRSVLKR